MLRILRSQASVRIRRVLISVGAARRDALSVEHQAVDRIGRQSPALNCQPTSVMQIGGFLTPSAVAFATNL